MCSEYEGGRAGYEANKLAAASQAIGEKIRRTRRKISVRSRNF